MKRVRTALVGLGGAARRIHLPAIASVEALDLVGGADSSPEARVAVAGPHLPLVTADVGSLLEQTRPELVIVATPPDLHYEHAKAALESGAHVLCEKPFVSRLAQADELIALSSRTGRLLTVNNQYRYMRLFAETQRRTASGEYGPLYQAQVWQQMFHPPEREHNWRARLTRSTLFEFGTHALDLLSFFFGGLPIEVTARIPPVPQRYPSDVLAVMLLDFADDRIATMNLHRVSHAPMRYLEMRLDTPEASLRLSLGGVARISAEWIGGRPRVRAALAKGGEARLERDGSSRVLVRSLRSEFDRATAEHLRRIVERIREKDVSPNEAIHAREILKVVFAAYRSGETRQPIRLRDFQE